MTGSRSADHFRRIYASGPDPWGFASSPYEQAKYQRTIEALGGRRFASALEIGCSIGVLTRMLAGHCDRLLGIDVVPEPLAAARGRCADLPWVSFAEMQAPDRWPDGRFDLIVFSEVLYFLDRTDIHRCANLARNSVLPNATIVLVNWLGCSDDPCSGDEAADTFVEVCTGRCQSRQVQREVGYRIDVISY
jgi:2-polyprenyl-3-methyl-5-hydroxy-6-metoxy-1,4-benzoquinol methylase